MCAPNSVSNQGYHTSATPHFHYILVTPIAAEPPVTGVYVTQKWQSVVLDEKYRNANPTVRLNNLLGGRHLFLLGGVG
jgi:hypothetical protein